MNILYINHYAGSSEMGMDFRPYYLAREWVKMGHNVRIVAGDYSHLRQKNPEVCKDFQEEVIDDINYTWIKTGKYEGNGVVRAFTMFRFVYKLRANAGMIAEKWRPEVVITSSTYPLDTYAGQKIKKKTRKQGIRQGKGATLIHEVHDMWPATLYEVGGMSKWNPFVVLMQIAENSAYRHCDKCVSLLPYAEEYMLKHGLAAGKFVNIQNGIVEEDWESYEKIPSEHKNFFKEKSNKFIVGYFGGHAVSNALDKALEVAGEFKKRDKDRIQFVFVGDGAEKQRLINKAKSEKLNNIEFLAPINKKAIPDLLKHFDCSYMTGAGSPLYRFGLCPNKMYDSMMAALPVVCAFNTPDTLVKETGCGIQCNPEVTEEVVAAIDKIASMSEEERKALGKKGQKRILKDFTYNRLASQFAELFQ